jgi:large subunit ribosomal protein L22
MGRAYRYQRRMSHIEITLGEKAGQNGAARAAAPAEAHRTKKAGAKQKTGAKKKTPAKKFAGKK